MKEALDVTYFFGGLLTLKIFWVLAGNSPRICIKVSFFISLSFIVIS